VSVKQWIESEWQKLGGLALLMLPFALLFRAGAALRRALFRAGVLRTWRAPVPVIVVGNISAGGTGKTPLVLALVDLLQRNGRNPGVVARGYGRVPPGDSDPRGVVRVYPDVATPEHFGDEPVLIARRARVPVYISPDRPAAARELLAAHREVDVIVSDDGLQHYALGRDIEIAVVDAERGFGNRLPLPSGPLREPVARLRTVDAVVMNGGARDDIPGEHRYVMRLLGERFASLASNQELGPAEFALAARGRSVVALAGIGNPRRFFEQLAALGVHARNIALDDHYLYQARDLKLPGADLIVMTEKDAVKCAAFADARMWFLRVEAVLPRDFDDFVVARLESRRRPDGPQAA
jgi:tetraacyldisaccharide 4'-kinase